MLSGLFVYLAVTLIASLGVASKEIVVADISREINLKQYVTRITEHHTYEEAVSSVNLCFPSAYLDKASYLHIQAEVAGDRLPYDPVKLPGQPDSVSCVSVTFPKPSEGLTVTMATAEQQTPNPSKIHQWDSQYVEFAGTIQAPSPYRVRSQALLVQLASADITSFSRPSRGSADAKGTRLNYGGLKDTAPWAVEHLAVHFKNNRPFLHLVSIDREITVSHWGRVYVTEDYRARHGGAAVTGSFSRWNLTTAARGNSRYNEDNPHITDLHAKLPGGAQYVVFKDGIGQILSMTASESVHGTRVRMEPRYPLLGGWETQFTLSYSMPLSSAVKASGSRREVSFVQAPLLQEDFLADVVTTRIALPEGSDSVRVATGRLSASVTDDRTFTYLDTHIGRPTKVITTRRMTADDTAAYVHVTYQFAPAFALLEPALLIAAFAVLFAFVLGASRIDLTIVRGAAWQMQQSAAKAHEVLVGIESTAAGARRAAEEIALSPDASKSAAATLEERLPALAAAAKELGDMGAQRAAAMSTLHAAHSRLLAEVRKAPTQGGKGAKGKASADLQSILTQAEAAHVAVFKGL